MSDKKIAYLPVKGAPVTQPVTAFPAIATPSYTTAPVTDMDGFAIIDADGNLVKSSTKFNTLLGIESPHSGLNLARHINLSFSASSNLQEAINEGNTRCIDIKSDTSDCFRLHIASVDDDCRIVAIEKPASTNTNCADDTHSSLTDPLTQLGNRRLLERTLADWEASASNDEYALIMMDLDRFKSVNDTLGHGIGDSLLKLVAKRAKRTARPDDVILRLGGDEFVVLHKINSQSGGAESVAERLVEMIGRPFLVNGHQINIGASVGIAVPGKNTTEIGDLLRHADLALYDAKSAGRGTYRIFTPPLEHKAMERRELEISLRRALALKQFTLAYQPQVQMRNGTLTGFEALIRWNHPELGIVPPDKFIQLAEETGEINAIGEWVLRTACAEAMKWPSHLNVAVNVSPIQFDSDRFIESICSALRYSGLPPNRLEIEITESVLINKPQNALDHLCVIQDMGVSIAMDDFGTGYSSLSNLSDFPFSKIKIDQAFVRGEQTDKSLALVDAIISLGSSLGMKTLAEGVETEDQYNHLANGGCTAAQGYLISRPLPSKDIDQFISYSQLPATGNDG